MAKIGLKHPVFAPIASYNTGAIPTYESGTVVGKAVKANITVNTIEGMLYADDALAEYDKQVQNVDISFEVDDMADMVKKTMFGYRLSTGSGYSSGLLMGVNDDTVHGGFGYYKTKVVNRVKLYEARWFYDAAFNETGESVETKGDGITFQTTSIEGKALPVIGLGKDDYSETATFSDESAAISWLHNKAGISGAAAASVMSVEAPKATTTSTGSKS